MSVRLFEKEGARGAVAVAGRPMRVRLIPDESVCRPVGVFPYSGKVG